MTLRVPPERVVRTTIGSEAGRMEARAPEEGRRWPVEVRFAGSCLFGWTVSPAHHLHKPDLPYTYDGLGPHVLPSHLATTSASGIST